VRTFLLFPKTIQGVTRWWEMASYSQEAMSDNMGASLWIDTAWVDL